MCTPQPLVLPDDSQQVPVGGSCLIFLSLWSLGILRENELQTSLFLNWLSVVVGQESQLVSLCTYPVLLMVFPSMLEKQSWNLPHVLALDLALTVTNRLIIFPSHLGHLTFLPSTIQGEIFLLPTNLPGWFKTIPIGSRILYLFIFLFFSISFLKTEWYLHVIG